MTVHGDELLVDVLVGHDLAHRVGGKKHKGDLVPKVRGARQRARRRDGRLEFSAQVSAILDLAKVVALGI
jgi:hypothetical protein